MNHSTLDIERIWIQNIFTASVKKRPFGIIHLLYLNIDRDSVSLFSPHYGMREPSGLPRLWWPD